MAIVTFTTKKYADIIMFGDVAKRLLRMMGHSDKVPGAILAEDVPMALDRLKKAIDAEKALPPDSEDDEKKPSVSMANRAYPLIELLTAAVRAEAHVSWK